MSHSTLFFPPPPTAMARGDQERTGGLVCCLRSCRRTADLGMCLPLHAHRGEEMLQRQVEAVGGDAVCVCVRHCVRVVCVRPPSNGAGE
eukprot:3729888-Rhodomonas_salina.1